MSGHSKLFQFFAQDDGVGRDCSFGAFPSRGFVARALRRGRCPSDHAFDRFLASDLRSASNQHWTPLVVARRAAQWLEELEIRTVCDVGSGAGKFCVAAALAGSAHFVGVEHRANLVVAAEQLAQDFGVARRVKFVHGTFGGTRLPTAAAYYFYNSFGENVLEPDNRVDDAVELSPDRHRRDVAAAEQQLGALPRGTYLLTYNGFGGTAPGCYSELRVDRELPCVLRMWRKTRG